MEKDTAALRQKKKDALVYGGLPPSFAARDMISVDAPLRSQIKMYHVWEEDMKCAHAIFSSNPRKTTRSFFTINGYTRDPRGVEQVSHWAPLAFTSSCEAPILK